MSVKRVIKTFLTSGLLLLVLVAIYASYRQNYLLFHNIAEIFSVVIACGIFMVAWNARRFLDNQYLLFLGIAYLFIGLIHLAHMLTYKGMNILPGYDANTPTQLWIAARYMLSLSLLAAPIMFFRRLLPGLLLGGYSLVTILVLLSIFIWRNFPDCYLENNGGLTAFKIHSEYVICLILVLAGLLVLKSRHKFDPQVLAWMLGSLLLSVFAELAFTTYANVYGLSNMVGHVLQFGSFICVYKALIETGLTKPYELLFRDLNLSRENYRSLFTNMSIGFANHQMIYDKNGCATDYRFLEVNDAFKRLTGLDNVSGKLATEVIPGIENEPADWIGKYGRVASSGKPLQFESHARALNRWFSVSAYSPSQGKFVAIFDDITARKQVEAELHRQRESLRVSEARFKLLSATASRLLAADKPQALVYDLCNAVMKHLDCQIFFNYLVDQPSGRLRLNAWAGLPTPEAHKIEWLDFGAGVSGCVARDKKPINLEDITHASDIGTAELRSHRIQAYCSHPLMVGKHLVGTLSFGTRNRPSFSADEVALMCSVADQVSLAIQREQTEESLRNHNEDLEETVRERTAALAQSVQTLEQEVALRKTVEEQLRNANQQLRHGADQLRRLAGELTMAEQRERKRLSLVLHDGLQQYLAIAKLQLSGLINAVGEDDTKQTVEHIEASISESIQISRTLSAELSPPALYQGGLGAGLKWLARWMHDKHDFEVSLGLEEIAEPPESIKILVFESVRELLFNAVKHAGVSRAHVRLESLNGQGSRIIISDQGKGFNLADVHQGSISSGLGLFSIRERIKLIGGTFDIQTAPDKGSRFTMVIPALSRPPVSIDNADYENLGPPEPNKYGPVKQHSTLRVLVADDHALFREGTTRLVNTETDMEVVAQACDGIEACRLAIEHEPDVILMDINMPGHNGIEATQRICRAMPHIRIIGLSMHNDPDHAKAMLAAGAVNYKNKDCPAAELIAAIRKTREPAPASHQSGSADLALSHPPND